MIKETPHGQEPTMAHLEEILQPLRQHRSSSMDYAHQLKDLIEMERRFRLIESLYALTYSSVVNLEKKVVNQTSS